MKILRNLACWAVLMVIAVLLVVPPVAHGMEYAHHSHHALVVHAGYLHPAVHHDEHAFGEHAHHFFPHGHACEHVAH